MLVRNQRHSLRNLSPPGSLQTRASLGKGCVYVCVWMFVWMWMYVCMYYVGLCGCIFVGHVCVFVHLCTCTCVCACVCMMCMHGHVCMCECVWKGTRECVYM